MDVALVYHIDATNWLPFDYDKPHWGLKPPDPEDDEDLEEGEDAE